MEKKNVNMIMKSNNGRTAQMVQCASPHLKLGLNLRPFIIDFSLRVNILDSGSLQSQSIRTGALRKRGSPSLVRLSCRESRRNWTIGLSNRIFAIRTHFNPTHPTIDAMKSKYFLSTCASSKNEFLESFLKKLEAEHISGTSNVRKLQDAVLTLLYENKHKRTKDELEALQWDIESYAKDLKEKNIFKTAPNLVMKLIGKDKQNALDYLRRQDVSNDEIALLSYMDPYTLEVILIHVLASLFNSLSEEPRVRVSTLVDPIYRYVFTHASAIKDRKIRAQQRNLSVVLNNSESVLDEKVNNSESVPDEKVSESMRARKDYRLGTALVNFLVERELIEYCEICGNKEGISPKKGGSHNRKLFVMCKFDMEELPIKLNLPMICEPVEWNVLSRSQNKLKNKQKIYMTDLHGGYLSTPVVELYNYRLLSTRNNDHFYIELNDYEKLFRMTIGSAIPFREDGKDLAYPYTLIKQFVMKKADEYDDEKITRVYIRIYLSGLKSSAAPYISDLEISNRIREFILKFNENEAVVPRDARKIGDSKRDYTKHMTALKVGSRERQPFIVADIETLLIDDVHVPYAVGFLVVRPGESISEDIPVYFSEDVPPTLFETFEDRSNKILFDFIERIAFVVKKDRSIKNVYFHNFSRFDGLILLKYFATRGEKYRINPLMRNHRLYELKVYRGKRLLFSIRDSLTLLPGSLNSLARNLCPHLGSKGSIPHDQVRLSNLMNLRYELLEYMKQDIRLLGGVMLKAQEIYFEEYKIDIVKKFTVSSLAMTIYRTHFYNPKTFPIHIPNRNEDTFIRRGDYGGHSDSYLPKGKDLKYYDVNSLYPYIMKTFPMPCGRPVWHGNLEDRDLDNLFGYFEAHIVCPPERIRPFLPYRDPKTKTIQFPTGEFVGVYFSEELKYAREIGYQVTLLSGYSFKEMNSPFEEFVKTSYDKRQAAKREGNDAMSYTYKILMNSLYGRFGISPDCSITEVCDFDRYQFLLKNTNFTSADKLSEHNYILTYLTNSGDVSDSDWSAPRIAAVQMAAAITAWARIYMHPYISRHDCYYTDTDSVVLGSPLPEDVISSTELGMFKLEYNVMGRKMAIQRIYYYLVIIFLLFWFVTLCYSFCPMIEKFLFLLFWKMGLVLVSRALSFALFKLGLSGGLVLAVAFFVRCMTTDASSGGNWMMPSGEGSGEGAVGSGSRWSDYLLSSGTPNSDTGGNSVGSSEASVNQPVPIAPEGHHPGGGEPGPLIPENPENFPFLTAQQRMVELGHRLLLSALARKWSDREWDNIIEAQIAVEESVEAALVGDGYPRDAIFAKRHLIRGFMFYPHGTCFSEKTYLGYVTSIQNLGTRDSIPYRRVLQAIQTEKLAIIGG